MAVRGDIRNVAIVAHVDHGKTTLVNAMLQQSHVFSEREEVPDRVMDSNDLEREKGITILAKNTAVEYTGPLAAKYGHPEGITLNIIDTPGHADFGGEVERGISMVDGVVLLVDASEGPLPQTRFVLRKALEAKLPVILCVNKVDRPDARIEEVVSEATDLLLGLAQDVVEEGVDLDLDHLLDLPVVYCAAKAGYASVDQPANGALPDNDNLEPLFEDIIKYIPAPEYEEGAPLQAHVANIDSSDFLGRLGLVRIYNGTLEKGKTYGLSRVDFKGRGLLLGVLIATMMIPGMALLIPVYKLLANMGLVNSYLGIIIPRMADVGGIFLLRQFFISIPKDLDNAARIDGAGEFRIFAQIILPNAVPAILTVGMFNFMGNWNDLLWPLIMTSKPETRTITAGLAMLTGHGSSVTPYGVVMAGALISALPLLVVFFFVQKRFVEGIAMTGMK